jgi:hypothetical protein
MMQHGVRLGALALTTAAIVGVSGTSAWGATTGTPPSLSTVQANAAAAITLRVNDLNAAISKAEAAKDLGSESSTLVADLQADIAPLQALGQQIAGDTTVASAQAAAATIFTNFRVLALVLPAARQAGLSVTEVNGPMATLTADLAKVNPHLNPSNEPTLDPLIADANAQLNAASSAASGIPTEVLGYTPADWNANHDILSASHGAVQSAANDLKAARADLKQIRAYFKSDPASATTTTTTS